MPYGEIPPDLLSMLARHCFTEFALEQPVSLDVLRSSAAALDLPFADSQAPEWFSAAAQPEADLILQAPELQILPGEPLEVRETSAKVADIDLIGMYAPELAAVRDAARAQGAAAAEDHEPSEAEPEPVREEPKQSPDSPDTMRLLSELSGLDD